MNENEKPCIVLKLFFLSNFLKFNFGEVIGNDILIIFMLYEI